MELCGLARFHTLVKSILIKRLSGVKLINDEMLETIAIVGSINSAKDQIHERYSKIAERVAPTFFNPNAEAPFNFINVFNVNVFGLSLFTKEIVKVMKTQKKGTIINIGSTASLKGYKDGSIYASSKFALRCLSQCWQSELRAYNIRVCQINPSEVTTAFGSLERVEREDVHNKLTSKEIAHAIVSSLEMDDRGFINELNVWATNPF